MIDWALLRASTHLLVSAPAIERGTMKRQAYGCGLEAALAVVGGKWKPIILWHLALARGPRRFGELRRLVTGISEKMMIQLLREMQANGIVARKDFLQVPPRVEYSLTPLGVSLSEALRPLCDWGAKHMKRIEKQVKVRETEAHSIEC
jgi:DNA-binding HxlR family transcriptional regulator